MWGGLKSAHVTRIPLESGNSIETGLLRQAFNISKLVQGSIGVDAVNADGACAGVEGVKELAVAANRHVEVGRAFGVSAESGSSDRGKRALEPTEKPATVEVAELSA